MSGTSLTTSPKRGASPIREHPSHLNSVGEWGVGKTLTQVAAKVQQTISAGKGGEGLEGEEGEEGEEEAQVEIEWREEGDEGEAVSQSAPQRRKGGKRARGMVLRWALLKALGPDRWHFAALLDHDRMAAFREAMGRALAARGGSATTLADVGAGSGVLGMMAAQHESKPRVTRWRGLLPGSKL